MSLPDPAYAAAIVDVSVAPEATVFVIGGSVALGTITEGALLESLPTKKEQQDHLETKEKCFLLCKTK